MSLSKLSVSAVVASLAINSIFFAAYGQPQQPYTVNCNGLQNFLKARKKYGRSALPQICSRNFTWRGRINCSKGLPILKEPVSMADADWICKKLIYARGDQVPYRELRALLMASGAVPIPSSVPGYAFKEVSCGSRLCTSSWIDPSQRIIHVTFRREGDQLATYAYK